ncbi:MAG: hypothetical protein OXM55_01045 [Bdellovibrionales bacterium]|nr:hypothetical protein [Bdellovibrionales bacterium]
MRFLILLIVSLSFISCGHPDRGKPFRSGAQAGDTTLLNVDADINVLIYNRGGYGRRGIKPRCRGINGCLKVCEESLHNSKCKQLAADKVIKLWFEEIKSYDGERAMQDLALIATQPKVANLLQNLDKENQIVESLFALTQSLSCPFSSGQKMSYSHNPSVQLYLSPTLQEDHPLVMDKSKAEADLKTFTELELEQSNKLDSFTANELAEAEKDANGADGELEAAQASAEKAAQGELVATENLDKAVKAVEAAQAALDAADEAGKPAWRGKLSMWIAAQSQAEEALNVAKAANAVAQADFQKATNKNNQAQKLFSDAQDIINNLNTNIEQLGEDKLKSQEALDKAIGEITVVETEMEGEFKKIIDGSMLSFDLPVFRGFIKQCFGYKRPRSFSQVAVEIENKFAFELGHQALFKACGGNNECVRLAYCAMDSDMVWSYVTEDVKALGCGYDEFVEMLP